MGTPRPPLILDPVFPDNDNCYFHKGSFKNYVTLMRVCMEKTDQNITVKVVLMSIETIMNDL